MTPPIRSTGNARPWVVQDGYRHSLRVPGPLQRDPEPSRVAMPLVLVFALLALVWVAGVSFGA